MDKNEIVLAVENYIKNENAKYAFMISGEWGSGKTFLYENYIVDAISKIESGKQSEKENVYISLYGVSTVEAISKQLLTEYFVHKNSKGNKFLSKGLKSASGIVSVISKAISVSFSVEFL